MNSSGDSDGFMHLRPSAIPDLVEALDVTISHQHGRLYSYGTFSLKSIVQVFLFLATSDSKRDVLIKTPGLLAKLSTALQYFIDDVAPLRCTEKYNNTNSVGGCAGGGGSDIECAELIISTLLQLAFDFEEDEDLQQSYMTPQSGVLRQMELLVSNRKLSVEAKRNVALLRQRLTPPPPVPAVEVRQAVPTEAINSVAVSAAPSSPPSHIMISYCWAKATHPEHVKALTAELRLMGYDVWRDEEGSSLVPAMSGSTEERMAEALESASILIICVSKEYKESPNCRMEAKYASQLSKKGRLQIYFVMMQNDYTTVSVPNSCNGWLGIMLGDAMWFSLWEPGHVGSTSKAIAQNIKEQCKLADNLASVGQASTYTVPSAPPVATAVSSKHPIIAESTASSEPVSYSAAWEFLNTPARVVDVSSVTAALDRLGILEAEDLSGLTADDVTREVVPLLKLAQRKKFLALMQISEL
eukprot:gene26938-33589_t